MTIHEVSKLAGVSVRTLHHYDAIGLLLPTALTEAGYRLYDDTALARLQSILLFRELEFPLKATAPSGAPDIRSCRRRTRILKARPTARPACASSSSYVPQASARSACPTTQ